jgi:hypothetical protein
MSPPVLPATMVSVRAAVPPLYSPPPLPLMVLSVRVAVG